MNSLLNIQSNNVYKNKLTSIDPLRVRSDLQHVRQKPSKRVQSQTFQDRRELTLV